ncbi:MAG TPA: hypothetical protein VK543_03360 [Puia sp.]|nr:hypothetical protein [Puia sp.]
MTGNTQHITQLLFGTQNLDEVSLDELRELVGEFPSFTAGHYLLSKKMKSSGHEGFLPETQKTALYFTNPFWLEWLLDDKTSEAMAEPVSSAASAIHEEIPEPLEHEPLHVSEQIFPVDESAEPYHEPIQEFNPHVVTEIIAEQPAAVSEVPETSAFSERVQEKMETVYISDEKFPVDEEAVHFHEPITEENKLVESPPVLQQPEPEVEEKPAAETIAQPHRTHFFWEKEFQAKITEPEPAADINQPEQEDQFPENPAFLLLETEAHPQHEPELVENIEEKEVYDQPLTETIEEKQIDIPETIGSSFAKALEDEELKFEPYHTIDYFASLGIKFIQEENPTDKFGKQLKSFTAWLKTMKRSSTSLLDTEMNAMTEATIQDIAEHSIEEKEVITEAMAEVLALQGKMDKAIELYHKLSLLNPSKSAYFAGRIEHFKVN